MSLPAPKTHRLVAKPEISARYLADFMASSERGKRSIVQGCKYRPIARTVQHSHARRIVGTYLRDGKADAATLREQADALRERLAKDDFDREVLDHNADYVERFAEVAPSMALPDAELLPPGSCPPLMIHGTKVTVDLAFRMRRTTRTNKVRVGAGSLRYAKGKVLSPAIAAWQSAFLLGYLGQDVQDDGAIPEQKLCITVDAYSGNCHAAPTDSLTRYKNMAAACETIAERWSNISPPKDAVL